jgi:hypothetical protein
MTKAEPQRRKGAKVTQRRTEILEMQAVAIRDAVSGALCEFFAPLRLCG